MQYEVDKMLTMSVLGLVISIQSFPLKRQTFSDIRRPCFIISVKAATMFDYKISPRRMDRPDQVLWHANVCSSGELVYVTSGSPYPPLACEAIKHGAETVI